MGWMFVRKSYSRALEQILTDRLIQFTGEDREREASVGRERGLKKKDGKICKKRFQMKRKFKFGFRRFEK